MKAIEQGVARVKKSAEELRESATSAIRNAQEILRLHMESRFIQPPPDR